MTVTSQELGSPGSKKITAVYDRSGGPISNDDSFVGFWKRNRKEDDAWVVTYATKGAAFTLTDGWGIAHDRICDSQDHLDTSPTDGSYSCRFPDDHTYELTLKANGKVLGITTGKISEDGRTMARTYKDADGKTTSEQTYEKIK